jgi:hypothetical protein
LKEEKVVVEVVEEEWLAGGVRVRVGGRAAGSCVPRAHVFYRWPYEFWGRRGGVGIIAGEESKDDLNDRHRKC